MKWKPLINLTKIQSNVLQCGKFTQTMANQNEKPHNQIKYIKIKNEWNVNISSSWLAFIIIINVMILYVIENNYYTRYYAIVDNNIYSWMQQFGFACFKFFVSNSFHFHFFSTLFTFLFVLFSGSKCWKEF